MNTNQYKELYELIKSLFIDLIDCVNRSSDEKKYIFSHHRFPIYRGLNKNGMPDLSETFGIEGPKDYTSLFTAVDTNNHYNIEQITSYNKVIEYFSKYEQDFKSHVFFSNFDINKDVTKSMLRYLLLKSFDCYMHASDSDSFDEKAFNEILLRFYNRVFSDKLNVSICAPILFVDFIDEIIPITDSIRVRKLTDKELLSIYKVGGYSDIYETIVISSALYILELQYYSISNVPMFTSFAADHSEAYPIEIIDKWFAALRITTNIETGYGQVLSFPCDWGIRKADLIDVHGDKIHKFNNNFIKRGMWGKVTAKLTATDLVPTIELFTFLLNNKSNSTNIAIKRLNQAYLRETEEDAIIDLMIGIEALVTENDFGEISYKVSSRVALVLSTLDSYPYSILETKKIIKDLYKYRSMIVHGESIKDKHKVVKIREDVQIESIQLAIQLLQYLIMAISKNTSFLKASAIDEYFFAALREISYEHQRK